FAPADYTFELPPELIAQQPAAERDGSRLLHVPSDGAPEDRTFRDIVELLPANAVLVANDTRVLPARILGKKSTGGNVELLLLEPDGETNAPANTVAWRALARARRPLRPGQQIFIDADTSIEVLTERSGDEGSISVAVPGDPYLLMDRVGHV